MAGIKARSPYLIQVQESNLERVDIELHIYTGTKDTDKGSPTYNLSSDAVNQRCVVEIGALVHDYAEKLFEYVPYGQIYWVSYRVTRVQLGVEYPQAYVHFWASGGYGTHIQGINPTKLGANRAASVLPRGQNYKVFIPEDTQFTIPFYTEEDTTIRVRNGGVPITTGFLTATNEDTDIISYVTVGKTGEVQNPLTDYLHDSARNVYFANTEITGVDAYGASNAGQVGYDVTRVCSPKYQPLGFSFVNSIGAIDEIWFFGNHNFEHNFTSNQYKRNTLLTTQAFNTYNVSSPVYKTMDKNSRLKLSANTGYYPEYYNDFFLDMFLSEKVWILSSAEFTNAGPFPVNITSTSFKVKTSVNEKLINYTVEFEYAFDHINNIR